MYLQPGNSGKLVLQHSPCRKVHLLRSRPIPHQQFRVGIPRFVEMVLQPKTLGDQSPLDLRFPENGDPHTGTSVSRVFTSRALLVIFIHFPFVHPRMTFKPLKGMAKSKVMGSKNCPEVVPAVQSGSRHRKFANFYYIRR